MKRTLLILSIILMSVFVRTGVANASQVVLHQDTLTDAASFTSSYVRQQSDSLDTETKRELPGLFKVNPVPLVLGPYYGSYYNAIIKGERDKTIPKVLFGISGSYIFSNIPGSASDSIGKLFPFSAGVVVITPFKAKYSIRYEASYVQLRSKREDDAWLFAFEEGIIVYERQSVRAGVFFRFDMAKNDRKLGIYFECGPIFDIPIKDTYHGLSEDSVFDKYIERNAYLGGLGLGIGLNYRSNPKRNVSLGVRGNYVFSSKRNNPLTNMGTQEVVLAVSLF